MRATSPTARWSTGSSPSALRDYVHVWDLAAAHLGALTRFDVLPGPPHANQPAAIPPPASNPPQPPPQRGGARSKKNPLPRRH